MILGGCVWWSARHPVRRHKRCVPHPGAPPSRPGKRGCDFRFPGPAWPTRTTTDRLHTVRVGHAPKPRPPAAADTRPTWEGGTSMNLVTDTWTGAEIGRDSTHREPIIVTL